VVATNSVIQATLAGHVSVMMDAFVGRVSFDPASLSSTRFVLASSNDHEDSSLVRAACADDSRAQKRIWQKYSALVRSRLLSSAGPQDLDDMVQEVFMRLFQCLPVLRDPAALRSFLIGITLRVAGTELRRRGCRRWLRLTPTGDLPDEAALLSRDDEARESLARLHEILEKLGPRGRRIFELRYIEKKELSDVARSMKFSLATAKRHLTRTSARVFAMVQRDSALSDYVGSGNSHP
jgi:RNA polymerase sigma-70 factor (ECF subfamily)